MSDAPSTTFAYVVVPKCSQQSWKFLLHGMTLLYEYKVGDEVSCADDVAASAGLTWPVQVCYALLGIPPRLSHNSPTSVRFWQQVLEMVHGRK